MAGPLIRERESIWQGEAHAGESPVMLAYFARECGGRWRAHSAGSSAGVLFICLFPPGCSFLCHLVLC
jgi:hypothetical protein